MSTYITECFGETRTVSADWSQASSPVNFDGESTQYQVADFRHRPEEAMRACLNNGLSSDEQDSDEIEEAISEMVTLLEHQIQEHDFDAQWEWQDLHIGVDGDAVYTWRDTDDALTVLDFETAIDTVQCFETCNDIARHFLKRNYSSQFCDFSHVSYWLDAADQKWALPCYLKKCGSSAVLWSDTDEAGIDDISTFELEDDAESQVIEFANDLAEQLGERVEE